MTIKVSNPLSIFIKIIEQMYPEKEVVVVFGTEEIYGDIVGEGVGTLYPVDGSDSPPIIFIDIDYPSDDVMGMLVHEMAHIVTGEKDHGYLFKKEMKNMEDEYHKIVKNLNTWVRNNMWD